MRELKEEAGIDWDITKEDMKYEQYDVMDGNIYDNHLYHIRVGDITV